jgi:UDP-N-acetyl-D-mannosaminuronic acid transferase (WecB/TagA/CpsF family)
MGMVTSALAEQRARVFVFFTDSHRKLSTSIDQFKFAMSQADHCFAGDKQSGSTFVNQKDFLDSLAQLTKTSKSKIAVLSGPDEASAPLARKLEAAHRGFSGLIPIDLAHNYNTDETITGHIIEAINRANPDIVLVLSSLKNQEIWIANYRHRLNC